MKIAFYIFIGIILALLESAIRFKFFGIGLNLFSVGIVSIALMVQGHTKAGLIILVAGSIILDLFSPYRFGYYLLFALLTLIAFDFLLSKAFDLSHPLSEFLLFLLLLTILHLFELLGDSIFLIWLTSTGLNAIFATILTIFLSRLGVNNNSSIKVSDDVRLR